MIGQVTQARLVLERCGPPGLEQAAMGDQPVKLEAELYACVMTGAASVGRANALRDIGVEVKPAVASDSQAVLCHATRIGYKAAKHVELRSLWLQHAVATGALTTYWVPLEENESDQLTKPLPKDMVTKFTEKTGGVFEGLAANGLLPEHQ